MLLGAGELGKEFAIAAQRLGNFVVAVDRYVNAPAMQVADAAEVISMLNGDDLERVVAKYQPDFIVPEIEAIRTEKLSEFEQRGITVIPTAAATIYTMNRDRIHYVAMPDERVQQFASSRIPDFDGAIATATPNRAIVASDGHRIHLLVVSLEDMNNGAGTDTPDHQGFIFTGAHDKQTIRADGHVVNWAHMAGKEPQHFACF